MDEGAIPFEAIERFAARAGIVEVEEFDRFERLIRSMDDEYRARRRPKGKGEAGNTVSMKDGGGVLALLQRIAGKAEG
ncbi:MAG TPA: hypothetical protein VM780_03085 [Hansschlegelia sp.]|nr:hypothetical protein [Hansschlegelia sp.]HVI27625.1 hypothetical protein [Hansschlegelia sp.]